MKVEKFSYETLLTTKDGDTHRFVRKITLKEKKDLTPKQARDIAVKDWSKYIKEEEGLIVIDDEIALIKINVKENPIIISTVRVLEPFLEGETE